MTGVSVRATIVEANKATMNAIPKGINIRPSMPERKNKGRKQATMINVELRIGIRTSLEASKTTCKEDNRSSAAFRWFSRNLLYTFSTSTIASSTKEPMAMARPPRLMVLIVSPKACNTRIATNRDKGRATSEMIVVRTFIKKKKRTIITKTDPSNKAFWILLIELSINRDWRNMSVETCTSAGRVFCSSCKETSNFSVNSSVFVDGCLVTVIKTAGLPFSEASPSLGALAPIRTSATSEIKSGTSLMVLITALPISSGWVVAITPWTMYSLPYS